MDSGDEGEGAYEETENFRGSGGALESLFAALQGQCFEAKPHHWTPSTHIIRHSSSDAKDIQSQGRFSDKNEGYV